MRRAARLLEAGDAPRNPAGVCCRSMRGRHEALMSWDIVCERS
jgi:hypothetical protein